MEIIDLGKDEWIQKPGFYRIPLDRHHSQPCMAPDRLKAVQSGDAPKAGEVSVTSGVLRKMLLETPADVRAFSLLNPERWPQKDSPALRMGRAIALYIEGGPEMLEDGFRVLPSNKPNRPTAAQVTAFEEGRATEAGLKSIEFWRAIEADPRDIITETEWDLICTMGRVLKADPAASAALGGEPEITMAWFDEPTQLWVLSRPDQVSFDGMLSDYKKVNSAGRPFNWRLVDRRITDHGYHMQMALAAEAFQKLTGEWAQQVGIVAQWDAAPHHVILRAIDDEALRMGQFQNRRAMRWFRECLDSGVWPGPGDDVGTYQMPDWMRDRILEEMQVANAA